MLGPLEIALVLVVAALVLGATRLPKVARSAGRGVRELNKLKAEVTGAGEPRPRPADRDEEA